MDRAFLEQLDLGDGARLPQQAVEAILTKLGQETQERVRFTAGLGPVGDGLTTREQIMAIPDRKRRRAAIARNLNLFEKEK